MARVQGIDVSAWQDIDATPQQIDFTKAKAQGAMFVYIRATRGDWTDPDFAYNWKKAKEAGLLRGAYHFHMFTQAVSPQISRVMNTLQADPGELPPALDVERLGVGSLTPKKVLEMIKPALEMMTTQARKPIFYSNPDIIVNFISPIPDWLLAYDLWVAHYNIDTPKIGAFPTYKFWQYSDRGDGIAYGMESNQVDMNWWNGTLAELRAYGGKSGVPAKPKTVEERVAALEAWARTQGYPG